MVAFKKQLEENKLIKKTKKGFGLTPKGERNLRIDAFEQIFQKLALVSTTLDYSD